MSLKIATACGANSLRREHDVLIQLRSDCQLDNWLALIPDPLAAGTAGARTYLLTNLLPGKDGRKPALAETGRLTSAAIAAIAPLHRRTEETRVVDDRLLERLVDEPTETIMTSLPSAGVVKRLAGTLRSDLAGRELTLGWAHGDFHPGNIMLSADRRVTGIVDWGEAREHDLSALDIAFWLLTMPEHGRSRGLGGRVADRLSRGLPWTPSEECASRHDEARPDRWPDSAAAGWLRHVAITSPNQLKCREPPVVAPERHSGTTPGCSWVSAVQCWSPT